MEQPLYLYTNIQSKESMKFGVMNSGVYFNTNYSSQIVLPGPFLHSGQDKLNCLLCNVSQVNLQVRKLERI